MHCIALRARSFKQSLREISILSMMQSSDIWLAPYTALYNYSQSVFELARKFNLASIEAYAIAIKPHSTSGKHSLQETQNEMRNVFNAELGKRLNQESFASSLATAFDSWTQVLDHSRRYQYSRNYSDFMSYLNRQFEPLRDTLNRTPSDVIEMGGRFNLLHYKSRAERKHKVPLLIVYSLINRYYILDLLPKYSVVNNLLNQGFDIYATDWETPTSYDKDLTLENYAQQYVGNAVEKIKEIAGVEKVSLFGYCWGGIFSLIYAATRPKNVNALILHATPVDVKEGETLIENWTSHIDADHLVKTCGNVPGWILNAAFLLRNPIEAVLKYPRYFSQPRTFDEVMQFFAIETWLYDSPPIIGEVYKEIVDQIYKQNLLIKNRMRVGKDLVNLRNVTMPVLDVVGEKDDLVPPQSSKSIIDAIGSKDKKLIEFPIGHVGLCISQEAHEQLWPEVGKWLAQRS
jgi:polyhydroxyalkanoate synthase subunit PhaC